MADIDMGVYYPSGACPVYKWDPTMVITVPADVLAPNGARSSAGTMMTKSYICLQISAMIPYHVYGLDDVIHNGGRLSKPHGPISVNKYAVKWSEGYRLRYWRPSWSGSWWPVAVIVLALLYLLGFYLRGQTGLIYNWCLVVIPLIGGSTPRNINMMEI